MSDLVARLQKPLVGHSNPEQMNIERHEAAAEIKWLESCLNSRDEFLKAIGQWEAYCATLPYEPTDWSHT